jgi:hypothetical protein
VGRAARANPTALPMRSPGICGVGHGQSLCARAGRRSGAGVSPHIHRLSRKLEESVGRPVAAGGRAWRGGPGKRLLLEGEVGVHVDAVGGADVFVAEPEGDGGGVDVVPPEGHRAAVSQGVWADLLPGERWAGHGCSGDVSVDEAPNRVAAERSAAWAWEQWIARCSGPLGEPGVQLRPGLLA